MKYLLTIFLFFAPYAFAARDTGGGSQIDSVFRLRSEKLIQSIGQHPSASAICSAELLEKSLAATKIRVVQKLEIPANVPNPGVLDAYTGPGDMQLKESSWSKFFAPKSPLDEASINLLVLHEALRTTGSACSDDNFLKSKEMFLLLNGPTKNSTIFRFQFREKDLYAYKDVNSFRTYFCALPLTEQKANNTCFIFSANSLTITTGLKAAKSTINADGETIRYIEEDMPTETFSTDAFIQGEQQLFRLFTSLEFISPERPFYLVVDKDSGAWRYGFDLQDLKTF